MTSVFSLRSSCLTLAPLVPHEIVPTMLAPHAELLSMPLRYGVASAKISKDVELEGSGFGAVQLGHDMGYLIPHVPYGPPTPMLAAHIAFSSCTALFGKATVRINGEQAAWWQIWAMLQVCADPVPAPIGLNISAIWTTVSYGFSWGDVICGYLRAGVDAMSSHIMDNVLECSKIKELHEAWALRVADRLYPHIGPAIARLGAGRFKVGLHNYEVLERAIFLVSSEGASKAVNAIVGATAEAVVEDPWSELSIWIDQTLADEPPPTGDSPLTALLDSVPVLE